jgi:hypothetical protein
MKHIRHRCHLAALTVAMGMCLNAGAAIRYVKDGGAGLQDGSSWTNAFANPQQALAVANEGDQIWVGAGTYKPGSLQTDSFAIVDDDIKMFGGFSAGGGETALSQRNPLVNLTYLSGDIDNDNILDTDNVWHVV